MKGRKTKPGNETELQKAVKAELEAVGLTSAQLAEHLNISAKHLSNLIRCVAEPKIEFLIKVAFFCGLKPGYFVKVRQDEIISKLLENE